MGTGLWVSKHPWVVWKLSEGCGVWCNKGAFRLLRSATILWSSTPVLTSPHLIIANANTAGSSGEGCKKTPVKKLTMAFLSICLYSYVYMDSCRFMDRITNIQSSSVTKKFTTCNSQTYGVPQTTVCLTACLTVSRECSLASPGRPL